MASKPRLYARNRVRKTHSSLSSSSRPDVLVLLDTNADSKWVIDRLSKEPILCQVIVLSDVNSLNQYYRSHNSNDSSDKQVYLVKSDSFNKQIDELTAANDDFYSIPTAEYTLVLEGALNELDEEFGFYHNEERLVKSLRDHLNSFLTLSDVELSSQSVSIETPRFAWFQFMFKLISQLERSNIGMDEVKNALRIDYQNSPKIITEFLQTYSSEKAVEWCMKDSFYFGHINRILRSKDIQHIFRNRAIIRDVEENLISWNSDQQQIWELLLPMKVYRGQKTSRQELHSWQSNIGSIITMNSFLSTSMDKKIAMAFTETFDNEDNDDEATLFTIWLDQSMAPKAIFAYLYHVDCEPDDQEILFSLRTLFRLDKIKYEECDETWLVDMTVVDETYEEVKQVMAPWKTSILKKNESPFHSTTPSLIYVRDLSADNGDFLSFQLSLDIILRLDRNEFARQEMLSMCRRKFTHDPLILAKINRFEKTYQSEQDATKWYTADSFLYRLLNEVLRIESVDSIFRLRYFIQDLHNQLALMQINYLRRLKRSNCGILKLYRGQTMTRQDFETNFRNNQGNLISMNSFLSTTIDLYVARAFAGDGDEHIGENYISVLYEITIDTQLSHSVPFAELTGHTNFEDENEVLFSMGAVFLIGEMCEEHRSLWTVKLTLTTNVDEQWNILTEHLQEEETLSQLSGQATTTDAEDEEVIIPNTKNIEKKRSRSFNTYQFSKSDLCRSHWFEVIRTRLNRRLEHSAFQNKYKEI